MICRETKPISVILDTDIGCDIDDSWALTFLLKSPEVDLKQVIAATGDTDYKARVVARILQAADRMDIPLAMGRATKDPGRSLERWVDGFSWDHYVGRVDRDGAQQLVTAVHAHEEPPVVLCIGPMTNLADALALDPSIAEKAHLVAMSGSFSRHEDGKEGQIAEWNVVNDIEAARRVYEAPWKSIRIAPLDSCGILRLTGENVQTVCQSDCLLVKSLLESVLVWSDFVSNTDWPERSSILFDTVAAYLCFGTDYLRMERKNLKIDEDGFMRDGSTTVDCAMEWTDLEGFKQMLADRLAQEK